MSSDASPFFEAPGFDPGRPRLLLLSYHFPPGAAVGALRWQKLAGIAAERGWQLDVITLAPEEAVRPDPRRLAELPAGTRVWGVARRMPWEDRLLQTALRWRKSARGAWRALRRAGGEASADARGAAREEVELMDTRSLTRSEARW